MSLNPSIRTGSIPDFSQMNGPARAAYLEGKVAAFKDLVQRTFTNTDDIQSIDAALDLAVQISGKKYRSDGDPKAAHVIRVATMLIERWNILDPILIKAALHHDSREDETPRLVELATFVSTTGATPEEIAKKFLAEIIGDKAAEIVEALTSPKFEAQVEQLVHSGDKRAKFDIHAALYLEFFGACIRTSGQAFPIKLADYLDNASNIGNIDNVLRRQQLAIRYSTLVDVFTERLIGLPSDHLFVPFRAGLISELGRINEICEVNRKA